MMNVTFSKVDLVLGYGSYKKENILLNRLIRYETFYIALQYFSAAIRGYAYMGVGRNLAFRKTAFLKKNPFIGNKHIAFGDDDAIVQSIAAKKNMAICLDSDSYTLSEPQTSFSAYFNQKRRHIRPSLYFKSFHKNALGLLSGTHIILYMLATLLLTTKFWLLTVGLIALRLVFITILSSRISLSVKEKGIIPYIAMLDLLLALSYFLQALFLPIKKRNW